MYGINSSSSISLDPVSSKYFVKFGGKTIETILTDKASVVDNWVAAISSVYGNTPMVVGLDIEWRPHEISYMSNKSATLQLCIDDKCLIMQLFYMDSIPQSLKTFLLQPNFTFVGIEVGDDVKKLRNEYGLDCSKFEDIREAAKRKWPGWFSRPGLKDLALEVAGLRMAKPRNVTMSNWENRVLSEAQVEYGCIDAFASFKVGHILLIEN